MSGPKQNKIISSKAKKPKLHLRGLIAKLVNVLLSERVFSGPCSQVGGRSSAVLVACTQKDEGLQRLDASRRKVSQQEGEISETLKNNF